MEPMIKVRLSRARWAAIQELARRERRSGTVMLDIILDRGMGGRVGYELAVMSEKKAADLMGPESPVKMVDLRD